MDTRKLSRALLCVTVGLVVTLSVSPAESLVVDRSPIAVQSMRTGMGTTDGLALRVAVTPPPGLPGDGTPLELTVAQGEGYLAFRQELRTEYGLVIPDELLADCRQPGSVGISGSTRCLDRAAVAARGVVIPTSDPIVLEQKLFDAKITDRKVTSETRSFPQPLDTPGKAVSEGVLGPVSDFLDRAGLVPSGSVTPPGNPQGAANAAGLLVPGVADAQASCDARQGSGDVSAEETGLTSPAVLDPVLKARLALAACSIQRDASGTPSLPKLTQRFGEAEVDVTATQTLVNVPQVDAALDQLVGLVPDPVRGVLQTLQAQLSAEPLAEVRVAPGSQSVTTSADAIVSESRSGDVTIYVLGGVAEVVVGKAVSQAMVGAGEAAASNVCSLVEVRALNLLTPDPADTLPAVTLPCPDQEVSLLGGLPAPVGDMLKVTLASGTLADEESCPAGGVSCSARAATSVLRISLFGAPLPNVTIELASAGAFAREDVAASGSPAELPVTGALPSAAILSGTGLAAAALLIRRRMLG